LTPQIVVPINPSQIFGKKGRKNALKHSMFCSLFQKCKNAKINPLKDLEKLK
jgi:hypothetical protein